MNGYVIALIVLLAYFLLLIVGKVLKIWDKLNITLWGPIMMWKTVRGRAFIERLSQRKRFWTIYGRISIGICIVAMVAILILLVWEAFIVLRIPDTFAPSPELLIGIPGINPIIPIWYGILGLAIAIIVHEFAHGILSRVAKIKVESLGLLFLIFPIGAFVEPNEDELKETTRKNRMRLFAAGPATNIIVAFICLLVLLLILAPSAKPVRDGAIAIGIMSDSPAEEFEISSWSQIFEVDSVHISNKSDLDLFYFDEPGESVEVKSFYKGENQMTDLPGGIVISVGSKGPAYDHNFRSGAIIKSLNDEIINSKSELTEVIQNAPNDQPINITLLEFVRNESPSTGDYIENTGLTSITLTSKWDFFEENFPEDNKEEYKNISYMGISSSVFGIIPEDPDYLLEITAKPFSGAENIDDFSIKTLRFIALPFLGYSPIDSPMSDLYEPTGSLAFIPDNVFWVLLNSFYWVFWLNLMVGIFNALPAVPLDGGYIFRDFLKGALVKTSKKLTEARMDKMVSSASLTISLIVLFLILWQLIGPRI